VIDFRDHIFSRAFFDFHIGTEKDRGRMLQNE